MGHRDIWGKNPSKWKKQCPCFDAEAEYAHLDDVQLDKYEDACSHIHNDDTAFEEAHPEIYVYDNKTDYTGFLHDLRPW